MVDDLKQKGLGIKIAGVLTPLLMYADDVVLLAGSVEELRAMNQVVTDYAYRNRYGLNGDKSAVMAFNVDKATEVAVAAEPWRLSGEAVQVKTSYKYLGVDLLTNVKDWKAYLNRVIAKATRVSEDLEWACRRDKGLRSRSAVTLWKAIVRPVLEYAAEIWAGDIPAAVAARAEAVQTNFARAVLGLAGCQSISNDVLRAEMGMEKLSSRWEKLRLGYWRRINVATADRALVAVASLRRKHVLWGSRGSASSWMSGMRDLLSRRGLHGHWVSPSLCADKCKDEWKDIVYDAVESAEAAALRLRLDAMNGDAVARYVRIKKWGKVTEEFSAFAGEVDRRGAMVPEYYLDDRAEPVGRRLKLLCRLGCLPTMSRVAREEKLPVEQGRCRLCVQSECEDLNHLLLACPTHDRHRVKMVTAAAGAMALHCGADFDGLSPADQVDTLLGKSTGNVHADDRISQLVARFLKKAWRGRKWLTTSLNEKLGRQDTVWALKAHGDGQCSGTLPTARGKGRSCISAAA